MERVSRTYTSDVQEVGPMREYVRERCAGHWGSDPDTEDAIHLLMLAVDEAAVNIVLHAYERRTDQPIELTIEIDADEVIVTLLHHGRDFDPATVPPPSYDGSREGGFGVRLIEQAVDEVKYQRTELGWCAVRMVKRRPPRQETGGSAR